MEAGTKALVGGRRLEQAVFYERIITASADDNVIKERDTEDFGSIAKAAGNLAIFRGRV